MNPGVVACSLVAFVLVLVLFCPTAVAAEADDRLLTRVDAYRNEGRIDLVVGLTHGYRYVSHNLDASGTVLQVRLRLEQTANGDGGTVVVWSDDTTKFAGRIEAAGTLLAASDAHGLPEGGKVTLGLRAEHVQLARQDSGAAEVVFDGRTDALGAFVVEALPAGALRQPAHRATAAPAVSA